MSPRNEHGEPLPPIIVRLIELGAVDELALDVDDEEEFPLGYIGAGESGLPDLGINAEKYLGLKPWGPDERPSDLHGDQQ